MTGVNLDQIESFVDPVDAWAATREFELRRAAWARRQLLVTVAASTEGFRRIAAAAQAVARILSGLDPLVVEQGDQPDHRAGNR